MFSHQRTHGHHVEAPLTGPVMAAAAVPHRHGYVPRLPWHFLRHLGEMILAMMVGMPVYAAARAGLNATGNGGMLRDHLDARLLLMTGVMAIPMVLWMRYRRHRWERTAEMIGGMGIPVVVLCLLWHLNVGSEVWGLSTDTLSLSSHLAMYVGMLLVMLYRYGEFAHAPTHLAGIHQ